MAREQPLPDWFLNEPPLLPLSEFFLRHFWVLDTERPVGMTQGRIPESKIAGYAIRKGLPSDLVDLFITVILALDRTFLQWCQEQIDKKKPPQA